MDNFLTMIYYERFNISERQKRLMGNNTWPADEKGKMANARNDQSITETSEQIKVIDRLIESYLSNK